MHHRHKGLCWKYLYYSEIMKLNLTLSRFLI
jgi:hypothetical protein